MDAQIRENIDLEMRYEGRICALTGVLDMIDSHLPRKTDRKKKNDR
jgi:hypothetical protein